ncbi:GNAT family N-acetyltransferase [Chitinibacter fontanus]|uniref:GNAT family N-acetyltransferase n=1 Tax=Chitinibacter fontanus TaxID=1737446 RepID=A0A7D5Z918_9NEIS|nr:GNAT family N-acetyltransferase [Chitinibacter fontanus]QLI80665.1 GNAT family N-acetyltransferase [Chitinibacter fontanus]
MNIFRYATLDDLDLIAPLFAAYRVFYEQAHDLPAARRFIGERLSLRESVILLAQSESGEALGFIQLYPIFSSIAAERIWLLSDLYVSDVVRGQGIARELMQKATQHARDSGAAWLELSTAHTNTKAQALYESLGYQLDTVYRYYSLAV